MSGGPSARGVGFCCALDAGGAGAPGATTGGLRLVAARPRGDESTELELVAMGAVLERASDET